MLAAVVIGYLADLLDRHAGRAARRSTPGSSACVGHFVQGRLIVRGRLFTAGFSAAVGLVSGAGPVRRCAPGSAAGPARSARELVDRCSCRRWPTGLVGPLVFGLCRRVDGRFARTQRERDAALEGLIP